MKTKVLFLGAFLCANLAFAQTEGQKVKDAQRSEAPIEKVSKVAALGSEASVRQLKGPARKNPLAAGRAGSNSDVVRALTPRRTVTLTGPAYKNRKQEVRTVSYGEPRRATRRNVKTGPRYKNRSAKTKGY